MGSTLTNAHIALDKTGRAWVDDTKVKVIEIAVEHLAYGWSAETIHENHPTLSLAQIYSALAWYYDYQAEMDAEISRQEEEINRLREEIPGSSLQARVRRAKK
jgi:uncharacterized protein (DUF433 family)